MSNYISREQLHIVKKDAQLSEKYTELSSTEEKTVATVEEVVVVKVARVAG